MANDHAFSQYYAKILRRKFIRSFTNVQPSVPTFFAAKGKIQFDRNYLFKLNFSKCKRSDFVFQSRELHEYSRGCTYLYDICILYMYTLNIVLIIYTNVIAA